MVPLTASLFSVRIISPTPAFVSDGYVMLSFFSSKFTLYIKNKNEKYLDISGDMSDFFFLKTIIGDDPQ